MSVPTSINVFELNFALPGELEKTWVISGIAALTGTYAATSPLGSTKQHNVVRYECEAKNNGTAVPFFVAVAWNDDLTAMQINHGLRRISEAHARKAIIEDKIGGSDEIAPYPLNRPLAAYLADENAPYRGELYRGACRVFRPLHASKWPTETNDFMPVINGANME